MRQSFPRVGGNCPNAVLSAHGHHTISWALRVEKSLPAQRFTCLGAVEKQRWSLWVCTAVGAEALPQAGFPHGLLDGEAGFPSPNTMKGNLMLCGPEGDGLAEDGVSCIPSSTSGNSSDGK